MTVITFAKNSKFLLKNNDYLCFQQLLSEIVINHYRSLNYK